MHLNNRASADSAVHYVQGQNKVESILASIREAVSGGVEFAEEKLAGVLELLTGAKLTAEEKLDRAYSSVASASNWATASASSAASAAAASATSAASAVSASGL